MGHRRRSRPGKILGLIAFIEEHRAAVRSDLLHLGLRLEQLGTPDLTWAEMYALAHCADSTTAMFRAMNGHSWSVDTILAAHLYDLQMMQAYQFNRANGGRMRKPKPFPRPEALMPSDDEANESTMGQAAPLEDIQEFLRRKNGR